MESSVIVEETPAKTRKISGTRNVSFTPQPMEICTPLATKPNGMSVNAYLYPLNCSELEMEVTPCGRTYAKSKNKKGNHFLSYSATKNIIPPTGRHSSTDSRSELEYSVVEAEELFRNASIKTDPKTAPISCDLPKQTFEERNCWMFFENVLKGFDDPQLRQTCTQ